jgi:tetratricopeptide (TPR) repeat protein
MPSLVPEAERENLQSHVAGSTSERMLREMAEAIEILTSHRPLLLVLEDLHWSDYSTLDLVSYLARRRDPARLMVIGTYRPVDVILSDHPLKRVKRELQAHGLCSELSLEYLSEEAVREYLDVRFPGNHFPLTLRRAIYRRTEGNPLFMVNLVEYLNEQKFITGRNGSWELRIEVSQVEREVPANLRQLIEQRLERLSPDERTVLEAATVAGMECSSVAIAAGLDNTVEWVEEHCEELARRHQFLSPAWLVELPDGTVTPRHRFIHVLYREVPYRLIAPMRRSQIHERIAARGIEIYGDRVNEIAAELAMHFEQSHDWPRTVEYILQAAEIAAARSAHHEAIDLASRGLEALKSLSEPAEHAKQEMKLRMILIVSLMAIKGFASAEAEEVNAHGRELFWRHGPSPELFYMLWTLNLYRQFSGEMNSSLEISLQLMELADGLKDDVLIMQAHRALAAALVFLGRCGEALEHVDKGMALCAVRQNKCHSLFVVLDTEVMFECFAALALLDLGYPDQSVKRLAKGLELARKDGHPQTLVVALDVAAQLHHVRGEAPLVLVYAMDSMELADEYGFAVWRAHGLVELGWAEAELKDPEGGIEKMRRGLADYETTGAKLRSPYFLGLLADQLGKTGQVEEGLSVITDAIALAQETGESYGLPELHLIQGELLMKSGDLRNAKSARGPSTLPPARASFAEALTSAKKQGAAWRQLRAALSMDRLEMAQGNFKHKELAEIFSSFTEGFETADLKQAKAQLSAASAK